MRSRASVLVLAAAVAVGRVAGVRLATGASRSELNRQDPQGTCALSYDSLLPQSPGHRSTELVAADDGSRPSGRGGIDIVQHEAEYMYNLSHHRECKKAKDRPHGLEPLIIPELKLAFCFVPKVACSQFKDMFNWINKLGNATLGFGWGYVSSMPKKLKVNRSQITRENGWRFAAFTRDPVLRYVSAFGSTCVSNKAGFFEHPYACCGPTTFGNISRGEMIKLFRARVMSDVELGTAQNENHWVQQIEHLQNCGWDQFKPANLDYWGLLTGDVNKQVKEMLDIVGYKNDTTVDWFFPKKQRAGHKNPMGGEPHDYITDFETLRGIMKLYEDDFRELAGIGCSFTEPLLNQLEAANSSIDMSSARSILIKPGEGFADGRTRR